MPHVILRGPVGPEDVCLWFEPMEVTEGSRTLKALECFLSADKRTALVRSLVAERGFARTFFVRIQAREGGLLAIQLESVGIPERTDGVKRTLGLYAWKILASSQEMEIESTNIPDLVRAPE